MNPARALVLFSLALAGCGSSEAPRDGGADGSSHPAKDAGGDERLVPDATHSIDAGDSGSLAETGGAGDAADAGDASHTPDSGPSSLSAGCGTTPPHGASYTGSTTDGNGKTRSYDVLLPAPYSNSTPLALTFAFHGAGATSSTAEGFGIQGGTGAASASVFVFPQGIPFQTYGVGWDDTCGGYDMPFFDHMVNDIESSYCIDTKRLFVAGFSWGCDFVTALDCCRGNEVRAVSAASCTDEYGKSDDYTTYDNLACPTKTQAAIRFTHDASGGDSAYPKPLFTTTSQLYQSFNGCPTFTGSLTPNVCTPYAGCADPFIECPYTGLGHATPSGWGSDTWAFFASFH
jgi:polyhydroxybutyrate depolymerase